MRVIKQSVDGTGEDKNSLDSRNQNPDSTTESTNDVHSTEELSELDPQGQGQKIKQRVERIVKLVQSAAQKVSW